MKKSTILITLFFLAAEIQAQSYEGYIIIDASVPNISNQFPVWVDLVIPVSNGVVTGTYFYKRNGGSIALTGTKTGKNINLTEKDNRQKVTGVFNCTDFGDSIIGYWKGKKDGKSLSVRLFKTDPTYKKFAKTPKKDELFLHGGSTLESEFQDISQPNVDEIIHAKMPEVMYNFAQKNVISIWFSWEYVGYPGGETRYYTFDLTSHKEIVLWNEIDSDQEAAFDKYLCQKVQHELTQWKNRYPDSEWVKKLEGYNTDDNEWSFKKKPFNEWFIVSDLMHYPFQPTSERGTIFYIENNNLHFVINGYFGFPRSILAVDLYCDITIPPQELANYLKSTSILRNLAKTP